MRAVLQRVSEAAVRVEQEVVARIGPGLLVLLGVGREDAEGDADYLADKTAHLRVFPDAQGQMNLSVVETGGEVLVVSQFTLYGDSRRGRRPGYSAAAAPEEAERLYRVYVERLRERGLSVQHGVFRAMMDVSLVNQGPVTILLDSRKQF
jgi:D-tyrosyl-tRNA(Tyr) deacylase